MIVPLFALTVVFGGSTGRRWDIQTQSLINEVKCVWIRNETCHVVLWEEGDVPESLLSLPLR